MYMYDFNSLYQKHCRKYNSPRMHLKTSSPLVPQLFSLSIQAPFCPSGNGSSPSHTWSFLIKVVHGGAVSSETVTGQSETVAFSNLHLPEMGWNTFIKPHQAQGLFLITKRIFPIFSYNLVIGKNCTRLLANRKGTLGLPSSSNSKLRPCCQYHVQSSCTLISACMHQHIRSETSPCPIWSKNYHHSPCLFVLGSNLMKHCTNINVYGNPMFKIIFSELLLVFV